MVANTSNILTVFYQYLVSLAKETQRNLYMPGDGRYQPDELKPLLGYDMWAAWLIIVEWCWMLTLAAIGVMPASDAKLLTNDRLWAILKNITTTMQDEVERRTSHDIIALLELMRKYLPPELQRWLHYGATSYDIICTAYALQIAMAFREVFWPKLQTVDALWRGIIQAHVATFQQGRTHLQSALPVTIGFWLTCLHSRFVECARMAMQLSQKVQIKFSGATGTYAAQKALIGHRQAEGVLAEMLSLPVARCSTQIAPPESVARYYNELVLLSGVFANLGEDVRILQMPEVNEVLTASSTSSAMAHKTSNPIAAENDAGMHVTVIAESLRLQLTLVSDFQRDLRWSNVMRGYSAVMVYVFQQLKTTERLLKSLVVNTDACQQNFERFSKLTTAELLHLALQAQGISESHTLVNKKVVPQARMEGLDLVQQMNVLVEQVNDGSLRQAWENVTPEVKYTIRNPEEYIGYAVEIAREEVDNKLLLAA